MEISLSRTSQTAATSAFQATISLRFHQQIPRGSFPYILQFSLPLLRVHAGSSTEILPKTSHLTKPAVYCLPALLQEA